MNNYYLKRLSEAAFEPGVQAMMAEEGLRGYGVYCFLLGKIVYSPDHRIPMSTLPMLAQQICTRPVVVRRIINKFGLFIVEDGLCYLNDGTRQIAASCREEYKEEVKQPVTANRNKGQSLNVKGDHRVGHRVDDRVDDRVDERVGILSKSLKINKKTLFPHVRARISVVDDNIISDNIINSNNNKKACTGKRREKAIGDDEQSTKLQEKSTEGCVQSTKVQEKPTEGCVQSAKVQEKPTEGGVQSTKVQEKAIGGYVQSAKAQEKSTGGCVQSEKVQEKSTGGYVQSMKVQEKSTGGGAQSEKVQKMADSLPMDQLWLNQVWVRSGHDISLLVHLPRVLELFKAHIVHYCKGDELRDMKSVRQYFANYLSVESRTGKRLADALQQWASEQDGRGNRTPTGYAPGFGSIGKTALAAGNTGKAILAGVSTGQTILTGVSTGGIPCFEEHVGEQRTYMGGMPIPPQAPPRPSASAFWDSVVQQWV